MNSERLQQQIQFIIEIDKLKSVLRRSYLMNSERRENSAEHSWHLTMMALVLAEHSNAPLDLLSVLKMLVVHDIVEIEADDTFLYDDAAQLTKAERENVAARKIFGLLPKDQALDLSQIW